MLPSTKGNINHCTTGGFFEGMFNQKKKFFFRILTIFFQQASDGIYLVQKSLSAETGEKMVKHEVPPATAANGQKGDITSVRFW